MINEYETPIARALESASCEFEIAMREADFMLEMVDAKYEFNTMRADLKVYNESGDINDLSALYTEAGNEATQSKEGILSKIINGIKNFISNIINGIKKLFTGESKNIPDDTPVKGGKGLAEFGQNLMDAAKEHAGLIAFVTATGLGVVAYNKFNKQRDKIDQRFKNIKANIEKAKNEAGTITVGQCRKSLKMTINALEMYNNDVKKLEDGIASIKKQYPDGDYPEDVKKQFDSMVESARITNANINDASKAIAYLQGIIEQADHDKQAEEQKKGYVAQQKKNASKGSSVEDEDENYDTTSGAMRAANESALDEIMDLIASL